MRIGLTVAGAVAALLALTPPMQAQVYGPQAPRDITKSGGANRSVFSLAPPAARLNLCNIHFHAGAEHRGPGFLHPVTAHASGGRGGHGGAAGFQCNESGHLSPAELKPAAGACQGLQPGDTIEVHWVHTSCAAMPGQTLAACVPNHCKNPTLRVEAQVFLVVNDSRAIDFTKFDYAGAASGGQHQAKSLPGGRPVVFRGSTTGPDYDDTKRSPFEVTWSVRPACARVDINSLHKWCAANVFKENHGHGVRKLVTDTAQLDAIQAAGDGPAIGGSTRRPVSSYCGGERKYRNAATGRCETK